jgi:hypothetical protein
MSSGSGRMDDPLARPRSLERLNYAAGMLLDAGDFRDEQTFHRASLALALKHALGMGTLAGLRVKAEPILASGAKTDVEVQVLPGVAIDPFGRLISLDIKHRLRLRTWIRQQKPDGLATGNPSVINADVFLSLAQDGVSLTPAFASGPFDALDSVVPQRVRQMALLRLLPRTGANPALPKNVWPQNRPITVDDVLDSVSAEPARDGESLPSLVEQLDDRTAVFLARVTAPVKLMAGGGLDLDLARDVKADNSGRPIITPPGKWLSGR